LPLLCGFSKDHRRHFEKVACGLVLALQHMPENAVWWYIKFPFIYIPPENLRLYHRRFLFRFHSQ
jgi:hypothetical protein